MIFRCVLATLYEVVSLGQMVGWMIGNLFFLNIENELNVLNVLNMLMHASLACWALLVLVSIQGHPVPEMVI